MENQPEHYSVYYTRALTPEEIEDEMVSVKLDPYRICDIYGFTGGCREHILKKTLRWTTKGDSELKVLYEMMQAIDRRIEMIKEDAVPTPDIKGVIAYCQAAHLSFLDGRDPLPGDDWFWYTPDGLLYCLKHRVTGATVTSQDVYADAE